MSMREKSSCQLWSMWIKARQTTGPMRHIESVHINVDYPCNQCEYEATQTGWDIEYLWPKYKQYHFKIAFSFMVMLKVFFKYKKLKNLYSN